MILFLNRYLQPIAVGKYFYNTLAHCKIFKIKIIAMLKHQLTLLFFFYCTRFL